MINATNPAAGNINLAPMLFDQEETSNATGENTNAAAPAHAQSANPIAVQGISALEYDANFSTKIGRASCRERVLMPV